MNHTIQLTTDSLKDKIPTLHAGDRVLLTGTVYTARDAAHKAILALIDEGKAAPFPLDGAVIYYAGPTPAQQGMPVGSCGPTTASRMDPFAPRFLDLGVCGLIGKGERSQDVRDALQRNRACYFAAVGGAGALIACCIESSEVVAFPHLGCESVKKMTVRDFPLIVACDSHGENLYQSGRARFATV